jgi:arsenite methyltransferase
MRRRSCPVPATRRPPWLARLADAALAPARRYLSQQARLPRGLVGLLLSQIWIRETATVNDTAIELLAPTTGERILELGFGPGRTLGRLAATGAQVVGVETSADMQRAATRRNRADINTGRIRLHQGDGIDLPVDTNCIDGVISVHTIYFWPQPEATLVEIARILRPGGRLVLAFRAGDHPLPRRLDPHIYRTIPTTSEAVGWLRAAGFTDVRAETRPTAPTVVWLAATIG